MKQKVKIFWHEPTQQEINALILELIQMLMDKYKMKEVNPSKISTRTTKKSDQYLLEVTYNE